MFERQLRLGSGPEAVDTVVDLVERLAADAGLDRVRSYWLRLAADEISTNITQHAYGDAVGVLDVSVWGDDDRVCVRLEDDGPPFDPRGHDWRPQLETVPKDRAEGGFGLLLALHKLDEFAYDRRDERNRNTMTMWLHWGTAGEGGE
jgi:anti-sigma regulatory factor (Ser/Thr protein kinase)